MSSMRARTSAILRDPSAAARRFRVRVGCARLGARNLLSRRGVTGDADVVLSLTSHGHRLETVHLAIESVARDRTRPRRFILWISDPAFLEELPPALVRLQRRGLEILPSQDYGPHKKQFPYVSSIDNAHRRPLVVCDDDAIYPRGWLRGLVAAHAEYPGTVLGYRAHTVALHDGAIAPYAQWTPAVSGIASFATLGTGVGGMLYPPKLLDALRVEGDAFLVHAPRADDIWVHAVSVRAGIRTMQIVSRWRDYPQIPGSQRGTLYRRNVREGGNDEQVRTTYGPAEIQRIAQNDTDGG